MAKIASYLAILVAVAMIAGSNGRINRRCRGNTVFSTCPGMCPPTCDNPNPEACIEVCDEPARCVCRSDYVLDGTKCVRLRDCPRVGK